MGLCVESYWFPPEALHRTGITALGIALHHVRLAGMLGLTHTRTAEHGSIKLVLDDEEGFQLQGLERLLTPLEGQQLFPFYAFYHHHGSEEGSSNSPTSLGLGRL